MALLNTPLVLVVGVHIFRWVIYSGKVFDYPFQAAQIPPTWNAWIHQIDDREPPEGEVLDPCTANFVVPGSEKSTIPMYDHVKPVRQPLSSAPRPPHRWNQGTVTLIYSVCRSIVRTRQAKVTRWSTGSLATGREVTTGCRPTTRGMAAS